MAAAFAAWVPLLGASVSWAAPPAVVAVLAAAGWLDRRVALGAFVMWSPAAALIAAGLPVPLRPGAWSSLASDLGKGVGQLATAPTLPAGHDGRPLAAALLLAGAAWSAGALLATGSPSRWQGAAGLAAVALPWIAALARSPVHTPVWQGALVLFAGLLWWSSSRMGIAPAVASSVVVALVSAATARAVGPHEQWFVFPGAHPGPRPFSTLAVEPTFGPIRDRRQGRTMLEIHAARPALWRMQTLDVFDGFGWRIAVTPGVELPQPAARPTWADVRVRALRNDLAVSPGRIMHLDGVHAGWREPGEGWHLTPAPSPGRHYRVLADVVDASADDLRRAPAPTDRRLQAYTRLGWPPRFGLDVPLFGKPRDRRMATLLEVTPYLPVYDLAVRLAAGARTEWEVVARVQHYLRDSGRFHYTAHVPMPGALPLVDFLLHDHTGYCQHFAGAAALLLRLAGVPTRVVAGFATGVAHGDGRYDVRDLDAHDWIEVYFQGYGWVAFNPTPDAAAADVSRSLDLLPTGSGRAPERGPSRRWTLGALVGALALAVVMTACRPRRRDADTGELLARLARRAGASVEPSTTLAELRDDLAVRLGPRTAALAAAAERARYGRPAPADAPPRRARILSALVSDVRLAKTARLLVLPAARDPSRRQARRAPRDRARSAWRSRPRRAPSP
jgi:transglutaminase-like putative cysteine protease